MNSRHTFIVGLTANTLDADREKCLQHGMDEYLSKPFDLNEFNNVLRRLELI
jgi:CheY-like chemotaxis protein